MVTTSLPLLGVIVVALVAAGCASRSSVRNLQADVASLRTALSELQRANQQTATARASLLDRLTAIDARITELQAQGRGNAEHVAALRGQVNSIESAASEMRGRLEAVRREGRAPQPPPSTGITPPGPEQVYAAALTNFRAGEHGQAVLDLLDFVAKFPHHPLSPHAQFWIGEAYYLQRDCRQALVEFQKVLERKAANPPAADALLRIGMCHADRRDTAGAHRAWQRLLRDYPGTEAAVKARSLLQSRGTARER